MLGGDEAGTYCRRSPNPFFICLLPRERLEAKALEGVAQQVEQNLEQATRRAAMAEAAAEQLRAQVARLTRENDVRSTVVWNSTHQECGPLQLFSVMMTTAE